MHSVISVQLLGIRQRCFFLFFAVSPRVMFCKISTVKGLEKLHSPYLFLHYMQHCDLLWHVQCSKTFLHFLFLSERSTIVLRQYHKYLGTIHTTRTPGRLQTSVDSILITRNGRNIVCIMNVLYTLRNDVTDILTARPCK